MARTARVLPVLFLGTLVAALDIALVGPSLSAIEAAFDLTERTSAWILSAFILANLVGLPFTARLGDVWGRRATFASCLGLLSVGALVVASAPTIEVLLAGRLLQGLGASGLFPMAAAVVGDAIPADRRGQALGLLGSVFGFAFLIGPIVAGVLVQTSWRLVFVAPLPLALVILAISLRVLPDSRPARPETFDTRGALLLGGALLAGALGVTSFDSGAGLGGNALAVILLLLSAGCVALYRRHALRHEAPILAPSFIGKRQVRLAAVFSFGAGLIEALFVFLPKYCIVAYEVDRAQASYLLLPLVLAITAGAPIAGRLLDQVGTRALLTGCTLVLTTGLGLLWGASATVNGYVVATILIGFGLSGLLGSSISYLLLSESPAGNRTTGQGVGTFFLSAGQILGSTAIGAVVAAQSGGLEGYRIAFLVAVAFSIGLIGAARLLRPREAERAAAFAE
jgi:MFS family permease